MGAPLFSTYFASGSIELDSPRVACPMTGKRHGSERKSYAELIPVSLVYIIAGPNAILGTVQHYGYGTIVYSPGAIVPYMHGKHVVF